jgi:hypothetical protein
MRNFTRHILSAAVCACILAAYSGISLAADISGVAAYVDGAPVTNAEIGHAGGPVADEQTMRRLEDAVAKKALVRVARMTGVDGSPEVKARLREYEEFLLVNELVERKSGELAKDIEVTDEEAGEFARRMCYTIRYVKTEFGEKRDAENFMDGALRNKPTEWEGEYTVVACEGVGLRMLDKLFSMDEGGISILGRGTRYYVIKVIDKERTTRPDELPGWGEVREYLHKKKVDEAVEYWISDVVERAEVRLFVEQQRSTGIPGGQGAPAVKPVME